MNEITNDLRDKLVTTYCDGAAMAYRDVAAKLRQMIRDAPPMIRPLLSSLEPFAESCERKAKEVYLESERYEKERRQ